MRISKTDAADKRLEDTHRSFAMNTIDNVSRPVQRAICMLLAAFIVSSTLTFGAYAAQSLERSAETTLAQRA
jgi:hypothetical protein